MSFLILGKNRDTFIRVSKISIIRKLWCDKNKEHFTRIFLTGGSDDNYWDVWESIHGESYEQIIEKIINIERNNVYEG